MGGSDPSAVLTAVARLVAESRSLRDVVARLAAILREDLPFDELHVLRLARHESFVLYSVKASGQIDVTSRRIGAGEAVEPHEGNARSRLVCTVRQGSVVHGVLWLTSSVEAAFTIAHQVLIDAVADLLVLAFQNAAILERPDPKPMTEVLGTMPEELANVLEMARNSRSVRSKLPREYQEMLEQEDLELQG